jgi:hypothetical protein
VTFFVSYLKGTGPALRYCGDCPPGARLLPRAPDEVISK